jgi:hypothetical protein
MSNDLPPYKLAFIIDNNVVELFYTDSRMAAILLSDPIIVDITEMPSNIQQGSQYIPETGNFGPVTGSGSI